MIIINLADPVPTKPRNPDVWIPACQGTETPFTTRTGRRLLYCWNPGTSRHAYLDTQTDIILTTEEAQQALGMQ